MRQGVVVHHENLRVWQTAIQLAKDVYRFTEAMPALEQYCLSPQLRRAAISIPANIAEGAARGSSREFARFVSMAQGSLAELDTHLVLARELHGLEPDTSTYARIIALRRMLIKLRRVLIARR